MGALGMGSLSAVADDLTWAAEVEAELLCRVA